MTTRTITICDGCGRDIEAVFKWELEPPTSTVKIHFHDLRCLGAFVQRELGKPKVVPLRPGISHDYTPFQHEEPKT